MSTNTEHTEEQEMTFVEHLDELRSHIIRIVLALFISGIFVFFATDFIFSHIIFGPLQADFFTYQVICQLSELLHLGDALCYTPVTVQAVTLDMGEAFILHIKTCFFGGLTLAFPFVLWELWKFIKPALYDNEKKAIHWIVVISSFLFLTGVLFGYFILSPFAINFLVNYDLPMINSSETTGSILKASSYINYMIMFTFPVGFIFLLPIFVYYLAKLGIITDQTMKKYRKHAIVGILVLSALVTPPDVMTQFLIGIPIYFLYEVSIGIAAKQTKIREQDDQ